MKKFCNSGVAIIAVAVLGIVAASASAAAKKPTFAGANWIWHKGAGEAAGTWAFQKGFAFPAGQKPKKARVLITCDNLWTLHVNGKQVGRNDSARNSWNRPQSVEVAEHLVIENNAIAIEGTNTVPGPSGLLVKLTVEFEDGKKTFELSSDKTWISTNKPTKGWKDNGFTAGPGWTPVTVIGGYGSAPWGKLGGSAPRRRRRAPKPAPVIAIKTDDPEFKKPIYKAGVVFVGKTVGLNVNRQPIFYRSIKGTRAYFEMDPIISLIRRSIRRETNVLYFALDGSNFARRCSRSSRISCSISSMSSTVNPALPTIWRAL